MPWVGLLIKYNLRLPIFIRPVDYDLELRPNLTTLNVYGIVKCAVKKQLDFSFGEHIRFDNLLPSQGEKQGPTLFRLPIAKLLD